MVCGVVRFGDGVLGAAGSSRRFGKEGAGLRRASSRASVGRWRNGSGTGLNETAAGRAGLDGRERVVEASSAPGTVVAVEGLIEGVEARGRRVVGELLAGRESIPVRGLVEVDLGLGWSPSGSLARGAMGEVEMSEDAGASWSAQGIEFVDASEELGPAEAGGAGGSRRRAGASVG